jgi:hypothetical protein
MFYRIADCNLNSRQKEYYNFQKAGKRYGATLCGEA